MSERSLALMVKVYQGRILKDSEDTHAKNSCFNS